MEYKFDRNPINKISKEDVVKELKRVAGHYKYTKFTRHEYDKVAKLCKGSKVLSVFGTWKKALDSIGVELKPRVVDRSFISKKELFDEMDRIWRQLGHRPSKTEWELSKPKYSYSTYKARFKGWTNACLQFIEYKTGKSVVEEIKTPQSEQVSKTKIDTKDSKLKREIPLKLRLKVLQRDNFCCVFCGKSPATHRGTVLHIDHIKPYSKGGKSSLDNLQTLCYECNLGKSDREMK